MFFGENKRFCTLMHRMKVQGPRTSNLGVGSSNLSERANNEIKGLVQNLNGVEARRWGIAPGEPASGSLADDERKIAVGHRHLQKHAGQDQADDQHGGLEERDCQHGCLLSLRAC